MSTENKPTKKYLELVEPRLDDIKAWARDGVIEEEIAKRLGIAYSTFRDYRDKHSALSQALKKSKEHYDNEVVEAQYNNEKNIVKSINFICLWIIMQLSIDCKTCFTIYIF